MDHRLWDVPSTSRYYLPLIQLLSRLDKSDERVSYVHYWEIRSRTYIALSFTMPHEDVSIRVGLVPEALMTTNRNLLANDVYKNVKRQRDIQAKLIRKMREGLKSYV